MDEQKVNMFIMANQKYLPQEKLIFLKQKLMQADESKFMLASSVNLKNPTTILIMSVLFGGFGVDRFMLGDTGMGVLKLLTGGVCGILAIVDWFSVQQKAKELNYSNLMLML